MRNRLSTSGVNMSPSSARTFAASVLYFSMSVWLPSMKAFNRSFCRALMTSGLSYRVV